MAYPKILSQGALLRKKEATKRRAIVEIFFLQYGQLFESCGMSLRKKIDVVQSRPSARRHKIINFTSKMLDFSTTGYLPFLKMFECICKVYDP